MRGNVLGKSCIARFSARRSLTLTLVLLQAAWCRGRAQSRRTYPLMAAISGLLPTMFMTRVKL